MNTQPTGDFPQETSKLTQWYFEPPPEPQETLRDKFAGQALTGCLAYSHVNPMTGNWQENCTFDRLAAACYALANAMMKARGEG